MTIRKKEQADIVRQAKAVYIISAGFMLALGLVFIIFKKQIIDYDLLRYLYGGVLMLTGIARVFGYFANDLYRLAFQYDMALGVFNLVIGAFILVFSDFTMALGHVTSLWVLLDGLFKFQTAIDGKKFGIHKWLIMIFTASATVIAAIFCEFEVLLNDTPFEVLKIIGATLIIDSLENIWHTAYTVRVRARKKGADEKYGEVLNRGRKNRS